MRALVAAALSAVWLVAYGAAVTGHVTAPPPVVVVAVAVGLLAEGADRPGGLLVDGPVLDAATGERLRAAADRGEAPEDPRERDAVRQWLRRVVRDDRRQRRWRRGLAAVGLLLPGATAVLLPLTRPAAWPARWAADLALLAVAAVALRLGRRAGDDPRAARRADLLAALEADPPRR